MEDDGEGILIHVYCYNVQPGITIDYATGESCLSGEEMAAESGSADSAEPEESVVGTYILNTNTMRFHLPDCSGVSQMSEANKEEYTGDRAELIAQGYVPCQQCNP